jgi:tetratricopeptide (TPR) repeat protein
MNRPLVFVAMPFGKKRDAKGVEIDFDAIYENGIKPAVTGLNLDLMRADEERGGGIVHKPMFERLLMSEIAIVDVTIENANVFYELGVRHTACPRSTIIIRAQGIQVPFDIRLIRAETYALDNGVLTEGSATALSSALATQLAEAMSERDDKSDSPLFQLIPDYPKGNLPHEVTENFRDRAKIVNALRDRLSLARGLKKAAAVKAIRAIETELGPISSFNAESAVDVMLSYRDVEAFDQMIKFVDKFPPPLVDNNQVIREQYALALNRRKKPGDRERARNMLLSIIDARGDSPETCGLLGRIYKDYYKEEKDEYKAGGYLDQSIDWYRRGFNADPRDFYPGINLLTMLVAKGGEETQAELRSVATVLSFALARQGALNSRDYWTLATVLEAAVHDNAWPIVKSAMQKLVTVEPKLQQLKTTHDNLVIISKANLPYVDASELQALIANFASRVAALDEKKL